MIAIPVGSQKSYSRSPDAENVEWHVSGDVGHVPPYGTGDLPGSDTSSKLIVKQNDGNNEVALIGAMIGLTPDTVYSVLLSKGYSATPIYWPGLFTITIPIFYFTTNEHGSGKWNIRLHETDFREAGFHTLSVWINSSSRTILISNPFRVLVG